MRKWTDAQKCAIEAHGLKGDILVTAAAGSGKTSVLTARVIRKITMEGCDIDRLLIVTFTRAAAAEMRERIESALAELLSENPFDRNLLRQRLLLKKAQICTIDSFCTAMLRENFQQVGISRDFRIIEKNEYDLIVAQTLDELLEEYYKSGDEDFKNTAEFFLSDKSDVQLKKIIAKLFSFLSTYAFPEKWLEKAEKELNNQGDINSDIWGKTAVDLSRSQIEFAVSVAEYAKMLCGLSDETTEKYMPAVAADAEQLKNLLNTVIKGNYEEVKRGIECVSFGKAGSVKNPENEWLKDRISEYRKKYKGIVTNLQKSVFSFDSTDYIKDRLEIRPVALMLLNMTRDLDKRLLEKKIKDNFLSFSDLARLCVTIVARPCENGFEITQTAKDYASRFDEILIDEYQDTNEVQDMIFEAISRKNRFAVGDVKQSIYSFRDADHTVFAKKKESFCSYDGEHFPAKISLNANFRSRKGVTEFVNFIFSQTMTQTLGGIDYNKEEALFPLAVYPEEQETAVEIDLLEANAETEATFVARKIKSLVSNGFCISDGKGGTRPLQYGDVAVLYRSISSKKAGIMRAFGNENIKINMEASGGLFSTVEVMAVTELLRAVDNPRRDLSLASAMLSLDFTEDEVAKIRITAGYKPCFYDAVRDYAKEDTKTAEFLKLLSELRSTAARCRTDEFLVYLYTKTGIRDIFRASSGGELKAANLELLITHAKNFEDTGKTGLSAFLRYIAKVRENGGDSAMSSLCIGENDSVNIMSIHKSKGLEFPVVFISGLSGNFNMMDANSTALLHKKLFFASKVKNGELIRDTLPHAVLHRIIAEEHISEELRVLYVAMTRAKEKLILTLASENIRNTVKKAAESCLTENMVKAYSMNVKSMLGWIVGAMLRHPDAELLRSLADADIIPKKTQSRLELHLIEELPEADVKKEAENKAVPNEIEFAGINEKFSWQYPFAKNLIVPTKMSVTALSHENYQEVSRPRFITSKYELNASERGTATHLFMSLCNFAARDLRQIEDELNRVVYEKYITQKQAEAVDTQAVLAFNLSEIGRLAAKSSVLREYGFEYPLKAKEVSEEYPEDAEILISGTADLIIQDTDVTYIVDYKTDKVDNGEELILRYRDQLNLYEHALSRRFGGKIKKVIYSFALRKLVEFE